MNRRKLLNDYYHAMREELGAGLWWVREDPFEVAVGAILTQNTNWNNVEKALCNLKEKKLLHPESLSGLPISELEELIRPSGFFRMKAARLHNLLSFLDEQGAGNITELSNRNPVELREALLKVKGIGPETADSILLYALDMPVFVVDAYTQRVFNRHGMVSEDIGYDELQDFFMDSLDHDAKMFNEFHGLIVQTAKKWCTKNNPDCVNCPLGQFLDT